MLVIRDAFHAGDLPRGAVATIGNFDGLHRGQRAIIDRVVQRAGELDVPAAVLTFEPHPLGVLRPGDEPPRLTPVETKRELLSSFGVDAVLEIDFTEDFASTSAREFVCSFLHRKLDVQEIHVGEGFSFGRSREGNLDLLREMGAQLGFDAHEVEEVLYRGDRISSTRIRRAVGEGRMEEARDMLGRPYSMSGTVARGDRMGKRLGWPTINLAPDSELTPADGVYAGRVRFPAFPATFDCVINVGTRPTVYENYQRVVESHILDFSTDVYGERVEIGFYKWLREERIFPTVMDLSAQIGKDVETTREYFTARRHLEGQAAQSES
jgi:riboflavin kinase/FMN adenylyltransferase